jgi:P4 family phage/plasmid primase-like protien
LSTEEKDKLDAKVDDLLMKIADQDLFRTDIRFIYVFNENTKVWDRYPKHSARKVIFTYFSPGNRKTAGFRFKVAERKALNAACKQVSEYLFEDPLFEMPVCELEDHLLPLLGGKLIDLRNLKEGKFDKDDYVAWAADFEYRADASWDDAPEFKNYLKLSLGIDLDLPVLPPVKQKKLLLLCQILAYMISNLNGAKKAFIFYGSHDCGKSSLLKFIKEFIGEDNYTPMRFSDLGERFRPALLLYKNYVINDELGKSVNNLDIVKKIISGEEINIEEKNKPAAVLKPKLKAVFAGNKLPRLLEQDSGGAFLQRLQVLRFPKSVERKNWLQDLKKRLWEERDTIMSMAIKAAGELISSNFQFADDPEVASIMKHYSLESNSVANFIDDETYVEHVTGEKVHVTELYEVYKRFCINNNIRPIADTLFTPQLLELGLTQHRERLKGDTNGRSVIYDIRIVE